MLEDLDTRVRFVTGAVVGIMLLAVAVVVFRPGDQASAGVNLADPTAWIEHGLDGELLQINSVTSEVVARLGIAEVGVEIEAVRHGDGAVVVDPVEGLVTLIDGSQLDTVGQFSLTLTSDEEVRNIQAFGSQDIDDEIVITDEDQIFTIDPRTNLVNATPLAEPLRSATQAGSGQFYALSSDGTAVLGFTAGVLDVIHRLPSLVEGEQATRHLVAAGGNVYLVDPERLVATQISDSGVPDETGFCWPLAGDELVVGGSGPRDEPLVVGYDPRRATLAVASPTTGCSEIELPEISGAGFAAPVTKDGFAYLANYDESRVHVIDLVEGEQVARLPFGSGAGSFDLDIRGSSVWANEPLGPSAAVFDGPQITTVLKLESIVAGAAVVDGPGGEEAVAPGAQEELAGGLRFLGDSGAEVLSNQGGQGGDTGVDGFGDGDAADEQTDLGEDVELPSDVGIGIEAPVAPPNDDPRTVGEQEEEEVIPQPVTPEVVTSEAPPPLDTEELIANFAVSATTASVGETVRFTDFSSGDPVSWTWDFGDGSGAQEPVVEKMWQIDGVYPVTLTVTNDSGEESVQVVEVTVVPDTVLIEPTADFTFDRDSIEVLSLIHI